MQFKNKLIIAGICAGALIAATLMKTGGPSLTGVPSKPTVVVTVAPQAAFVREVAGDLVNIVTVLPPGANHESYSPLPQDMEQISRASLYLALGLPP